jgi:hypothetical protein
MGGCFDAEIGVVQPDGGSARDDLGAARSDGSAGNDARADAGAAIDATLDDRPAAAGDAAPGFPDGSVVLADGAVRLPDGAVVAPPVSGCVPMELCNNGLDDNCDGRIDEACPCLPGQSQRCYAGAPAEAGRGVCNFGMQQCEGTGEFGAWGACAGAGAPRTVTCGGGMDWRCNGVIDEGCACTPGMTRACYSGPPSTSGVGACRAGTSTCAMTATGAAWGPCEGEVTPGPGQCDGVDRACNGAPEAGCECILGRSRECYSGPAGTAGVGACRAGSQACGRAESGRTAWGACVGEVTPTDDTCDGIDRSCTGAASRCACVAGSVRACYSGPAATNNVGLCHGGMQRCIFTGGGSIWGACEGEVTPQTDRCDGVDRACVGRTTACTCLAGETRSCYSGAASTLGVGPCHAGTQRCVVTGGASSWGSCEGEVSPQPDLCDGIDRSCSGGATRCACVATTTRPCYTGAPGTEGVGACHGGTQTCVASGGTSNWSGCAGEVTTNCLPCLTASGSPWQINRASGPVCFGRTFSVHGDPGEYALATIPSEGDGAWVAVPRTDIAFADSSALCGRSCTCLDGGEFTFFQTFFDIPVGFAVSSLIVRIGSVDDGVRITVHNSRYPAGIVDPGSYVLLGSGGATTDLARYIVPGRNRIVLTHIDDCCSARSISGVSVDLNGGSLTTCP